MFGKYNNSFIWSYCAKTYWVRIFSTFYKCIFLVLSTLLNAPCTSSTFAVNIKNISLYAQICLISLCSQVLGHLSLSQKHSTQWHVWRSERYYRRAKTLIPLMRFRRLCSWNPKPATCQTWWTILSISCWRRDEGWGLFGGIYATL